MRSILKYYNEYFYFDPGAELFHDYTKFGEYYDLLDHFNKVLLFEDIVSIAPMANINNKIIFTNAVQSLFLSVLANETFPLNSNHLVNTDDFENATKNAETTRRFIPYKCRIEFRIAAIALRRELKTSLIEQRKPNVKPIDVLRESLHGLPEIENELIATRVADYLSIVEYFIRDTSQTKNVFTIERITQVIGELICSNDMNDCVSKSFLCSWFSKETESVFSLIRQHCLSHYRASSVQGRMNLEFNELEINDTIRKEIMNVYQIFEPITKCVRYGIKEFFFKKGMNESPGENDIFKFFQNEYDRILDIKRIDFRSNLKYYRLLSRNMLRYISESLESNRRKRNNSQNNDKDLTLEDKKNQFISLIYLGNHISVCIEASDNSLKLIENSKKLNDFISSHSQRYIHEVKEEILDILKEADTIYNTIFSQFEVELSENKMWKVYNIIAGYVVEFRSRMNNLGEFTHFEKNSNNCEKLLEEMLLKFFSQLFDDDHRHSEVFANSMAELKRLVKHMSEHFTVIELNCYLNHLPSVLEYIDFSVADEIPDEINFNAESLNDYYKKMKDHDCFSSEDREVIKKSISDRLRYSNENQQELQDYLEMVVEKNDILDNEKVEKTLKSIVMPEKKRNDIIIRLKKSDLQKVLKIIKALKIKVFTKFECAENATLLLREILGNDKYRYILFRISFDPPLQKKIYTVINQKIHVMINRIELMKKILIDGDVIIKSEWDREKNPCEEEHMKILICQKYIANKGTRAALEMLIFDCFNILQDTELHQLYKKTSNLFNRVNLRDFLSHGSPVIEVVGNYLDPDDLLMEFVNKILELINDKDVLCALSELWEKVKSRKSSDLKTLISGEYDDEYNYLRLRIKSSNYTVSYEGTPRWEIYLELLNLDPDTSEW